MSTTPPISLQEAIDLMDTLPREEAMTDSRLMNFISSIDDAGVEILSELEDDRVLGEIAFIQASAIAVILQQRMERGDIVGAMEIMKLTSSDVFSHLITVAFKLSVGLSALEEWK